MKKSMKALMITAMAAAAVLTGCSSKPAETQAPAAETTAEGITTGDTAVDTTTVDTVADDASYTVGIGQFAAHGSLDNCWEGSIQGLADAGIVGGQDLIIFYENAQADGGTASQINTNLAVKNVDLICGIATPMAQSVYGVAKKANIPVIYIVVTDPVVAELASADGTPVGEITGTSDTLSVRQQLEMTRVMLPDAKTIGIIHTTSEVSSIFIIAQYKEAAPEYGFEIVETGTSATADVPLAASSLLGKVDCVTNLTDNTVVASLPVVLDKTAKKNIPVLGSEIEQVKISCLVTMGLDYVRLGKQIGAMAAKVLKGEARASETNYEVIAEAAFYGNEKVTESLGPTIPEDLADAAVETFTKITQ